MVSEVNFSQLPQNGDVIDQIQSEDTVTVETGDDDFDDDEGDILSREFQTGLSYVAVSRVTSLKGLLFEAPFDRNNLCKTERTLAWRCD
jgi:hypothetical protein